MFEPASMSSPVRDRARPELRSDCGVVIELDIERYVGTAGSGERRLLRDITGPVLDIGCGPGRAAAFLRRHGTPALGIEVSAGLVDLARLNGALCVHQSVFDPVPFEGRWHNVLLLDGNIGIGGDPVKMLARLREIVDPDGRAYVEVQPSGPTRQLIVREHLGDVVGDPFGWAVVAMSGVDRLIAGSGWRRRRVHTVRERLDGEAWHTAERRDRVVLELETTS